MEKLFELAEEISINNYEFGLITYNIIEENSNGDVREKKVDIASIEIDNDTVMFIDFNDDTFKYFLLSSVKEVIFIDDPKSYKVCFKSGSSMTIIPVI